MPSGFGVDPTRDANGNIISGTTAQDVRRIQSGLYSPGVISGSTVELRSDAMSYNVNGGVVSIFMNYGESVLAAVPYVSVDVDPVPTTGGRTDYIYAYQNIPALEGNSDLVIKCGTSVPLERAVILDVYDQPAGATNTSRGVRHQPVQMSIPYGGTMGVLVKVNYTYDGVLQNSNHRIGNTSFYLPTDRLVTFRASAVLSASGATKFDATKYCEYGFLPNIDNNDIAYWTSAGLHQAWATYQWSMTLALKAGPHTSNLGLQQVVGPGLTYCHYGKDNQGLWRDGITYSITDAGVQI